MKQAKDLKFSAIIPTYNRRALISRAILSAIKQEHPPAEIIIVDDGSTDSTFRDVEPFWGLVTYIYQSNAGVAAARDRGVISAKYDWIAFLDSDDVWLETYLKTMTKAIQKTSAAAPFYFTDTIQPSTEGRQRRWEKIKFKVDSEYQLVSDATDWVMMRPQPMMLQSSVINRSAYLECGGFSDELQTREDTHLFIRLGLNGPACAVDGVGTQMTADAAPQERLTASHDGDQPGGYRMQVIMFEDILSNARNLKPEIRHEFKHRLAAARRRLARIALQKRDYTATFVHMKESFIHDPLTFVRQFFVLMMSRFRNNHSPTELNRSTK